MRPRRIVPLLAVLAAVGFAPAAAQSFEATPADVVRSAERAVQDDSVRVVQTRWRAALRRDSTDREATLGLATLARVTYDFESAERLLGGLLARAGSAPDGWTVHARLGQYRVANSTGDYRRADSLLRLAVADARRIGDRRAEIAALIGFTNTRSGGRREALLATLDSVRRLLSAGDGRDRAEYLCRLGLYQGVAGDTGGSTVVRRGTAMAERGGERQLAGHCLEAEGLLESLRGHNDSALATLDRATALLRATREHAGLARLESRRSDILQEYGRLGEARVALGRVLAEATISKNRQRVSSAYGGIGAIALRVGDLPTAAAYFERGAALADSLGLEEGGMIARQNRAEVLAMSGDLEGARSAFQGALAEADSNDFFEDAVHARQSLARVAIRQGSWSEAARQLDLAGAAARAHGLEDVRAGLAYDQGRLALGQSRPAEAARLFAAVLARAGKDDQLLRYTTRTRLAEAYAAQGHLRRAERELTEASGELEQWRASLGAEELRRYAFATTALGEHDPQAAVARVIAALASGGRAEAAFSLAERRRARTLADRLIQADALRATSAAATTHRDHPAGAAEVAAALADDSTAIVEYVAGSEGAPTTLFLVTRTGIRARLLPPADSLARPIERFTALLEAGDSGSTLARSLGAAVLGPVAALPHAVTRLIVIPDGPLHRIPFDALVMPDGRLAVERWAVGLAPSAAVAMALRQRERNAATEPPRILALGDPAFASERTGVAMRGGDLLRGAFDATGGLPRLAGSGDEVRDVARYAPGHAEVRLRADASEAWLKRAAVDGFRVIHLATHALVDEGSLARTALALAPGAGEDGFLGPADIAALRLRADLVVLSACRTAGGVMVSGEGLQGLTTPLLEAGARSVIATQWRIGDRGTVRLVHDVYTALAQGAPVSEALREAKLSAIRRGAPASEWAGFTVVGDPLVRIPLRAPAPTAPVGPLAVVVGMLALVAGYLGLRRRGRMAEVSERASAVVARTHQR